MLTAYFDESGEIKGGLQRVTLAGCMWTKEKSQFFEKQWIRRLEDEQLTSFHGRDLKLGKGQFSTWHKKDRSGERGNKLQHDLLEIISSTSSGIVGFSSVLHLITPRRKNKWSELMKECIEKSIRLLVIPHIPTYRQPIELIYANQEHVNVNQIILNSECYRRLTQPLQIFERAAEDTPQLQAADLVVGLMQREQWTDTTLNDDQIRDGITAGTYNYINNNEHFEILKIKCKKYDICLILA